MVWLPPLPLPKNSRDFPSECVDLDRLHEQANATLQQVLHPELALRVGAPLGKLDYRLRAVPVLHLVFYDIEAADDGLKEVVELMRHTARELAQRLQLLGFAQLVL